MAASSSAAAAFLISNATLRVGFLTTARIEISYIDVRRYTIYSACISEKQVKPPWRSAEPLIAAALGAHIAVLVLTKLAAPAPLSTALVATIVFAGISLAYAIRGRIIVLNGSAALQLQAGT
jgi:phosphate/sulfate permease